MGEIFLETKAITKKFGDVVAVNNVDLTVRLGEIQGLIGENGSGKSTISSMICGIHSVTSGEMILKGRPYRPADPGQARANGIGMIVQEAGTVDYLSVAENIFLGEEKRFSMSYFYRVPEEEYSTVANFLLAASQMDEREVHRLGELSQLHTFFRIAFDEMEGRDEKLQALAVRVADRTRSDEFLRDVLLDHAGSEFIKISILHALTMRNEEDSFGIVICDLYREFVTHKLEIGEKKREDFLKAFADVYAKFAVLGDENAGKICAAAEDVYLTLEECGALSYCDERASLAAAIYRESRLSGGERSFEEIVKMFGANKFVTERILDYMI